MIFLRWLRFTFSSIPLKFLAATLTNTYSLKSFPEKKSARPQSLVDKRGTGNIFHSFGHSNVPQYVRKNVKFTKTVVIRLCSLYGCNFISKVIRILWIIKKALHVPNIFLYLNKTSTSIKVDRRQTLKNAFKQNVFLFTVSVPGRKLTKRECSLGLSL